MRGIFFYQVHNYQAQLLCARKPPRTSIRGNHLYFIDEEVEALGESSICFKSYRWGMAEQGFKANLSTFINMYYFPLLYSEGGLFHGFRILGAEPFLLLFSSL